MKGAVHFLSIRRATKIAVVLLCQSKLLYEFVWICSIYCCFQENPKFNESFQNRETVRLASLNGKLFNERPRAGWGLSAKKTNRKSEKWIKPADCFGFLYQSFKIELTWRTIQHAKQTGDVFQGSEAHNCGFMAALAAIADHEDGYLVRLLLQHSEHDELKPGRLKRSERNKKRSELSNRCATRVFHYSAIIFAKNHHSLRHICSFSRKDSSLWRHACQSMSFIDLALQAMFCSLYLFYTFVYIYIHTHTLRCLGVSQERRGMLSGLLVSQHEQQKSTELSTSSSESHCLRARGLLFQHQEKLRSFLSLPPKCVFFPGM